MGVSEASVAEFEKGTCQVRLLHSLARTHASFDDPNLVSHAGLVPVMALAQRAGLAGLVAEHVRPGGECGVNPELKVPCLVAGMAAGADSIEDMGLLRHGAMPVLFGGVRAPSTLGSHLRCYTWGNVAQLEKAGREFLVALAGRAPLLPGAGTLAFIDIDSMQKRVYGHKKQGARFGHTKIQGKSLLVRGLNALAATVSTPLSAPVIAATRLRGGNAASARGAASLAARAIGTAREAGCTGTIIVRLDSAFYNAAVIGAIRRGGARFSVTAPANASIRAAIAAIPGNAWIPIRYPRAIWDDQLGAWVSDAEVAEVEYTAFASKKGQAVTARLIIRRVRDLNKKAETGQDELFPVWRYHAVFTDSPFELIQAEGQHRDHAVVEQVFADVTSGPLAHMPSGVFAANAAWLSVAAMVHNLLRAAGALASLPFARARAVTIRRDLIAVAARTARHGRGHLTLHLPEGWHREHEWLTLLHAACGPPATAA
jgi:Transposase DDE domain group 1